MIGKTVITSPRDRKQFHPVLGENMYGNSVLGSALASGRNRFNKVIIATESPS